MTLCLKELFFVLFLIYFTRTQGSDVQIETVLQKNKLEFGFDNPRDEEEALANGNYVVGGSVPIEVVPTYKENGDLRIFVSIPRFGGGVPYSFATVAPDGKLRPYPEYNWHNSHGADCDGISSAFRVALTPCNQMWVVDSGYIAGEHRCPPQLLLFDLKTDQLIHRYRYDKSVNVPGASLFNTPVIKVEDPAPEGKCENTKVYVSDTWYHGLVVYDQATNSAWRAENRFMYPDPDMGVHTIAGEQFTLMDGIFGLNIVGDNLYFHPLASDKEFSVPLKALNDRSAFEQSRSAHENEFSLVGSRGSECAATASDSRGNIYCVTFNPARLIRWKVGTQYQEDTLERLSSNEEILQFVSGMKVVKNPEGKEELWMQSNRYQKFAAGTLNSNEVNFRILKHKLE